MRTRADVYRWEKERLAPWASRAEETRGRAFEEEEHPRRSPFERDRDRVVHSSAFRKLEYKTQVFVNHEGDYYRTRLTHSLEVSQIARSVARLLSLNEDLVEAVALVHDVGHPPFGHAGETALQGRMGEAGSFEHNRQGLRVVSQLEQRYPDFPGLNLTWEVREAIAKHSKLFDPSAPLPEFSPFAEARWPSLEAQVVDACDAIAYNAHDVDDGLTAGMIFLDDLDRLAIWQAVRTEEASAPGLTAEQRKYLGVRALINAQITDLAASVEKRLEEWEIRSALDVRTAPAPVVALNEEMAQIEAELRAFLLANVYRNYRVTRMGHKAKRVLESLFDAFASAPEQLPPATAARVAEDGLPRAVCDHLASLTDREAFEEYRRLFDVSMPA
jgi:dGTPase